MATEFTTIDAAASTDASGFGSYLRQLLSVSNAASNWKAKMDKVIGGGADWQQLQKRYGIELDGVAATDAQVQTVYNLLAGSTSDMNATEASPAQTRQLVTQVGPK